ncbi:MAG: pyrimidine dimer DNA glycosylase/endonuclease V [Pseudomonadota bacterium]
MQTFLPYADFAASAAALDDRRLGKQRVEALTILNILEGRTKTRAWRHHPALLMWRGFEPALGLYLNAVVDEWERRGFVNNIPRRELNPALVKMPWWLGDERLHASHRANLLRKLSGHYQALGWREDPSAPYWWPVSHKDQAAPGQKE